MHARAKQEKMQPRTCDATLSAVIFLILSLFIASKSNSGGLTLMCGGAAALFATTVVLLLCSAHNMGAATFSVGCMLFVIGFNWLVPSGSNMLRGLVWAITSLTIVSTLVVLVGHVSFVLEISKTQRDRSKQGDGNQAHHTYAVLLYLNRVMGAQGQDTACL